MILSSLLISHDASLLLFHRHKQKVCDIKTSLSTMLLTIHPGLHGPLPQALEWCGILSQLKKTKVGNGSFSEQAEQIYPSVLCLGSHYFIPQGRTSPGKRPDKEQSELAFLSNSARRFRDAQDSWQTAAKYTPIQSKIRDAEKINKYDMYVSGRSKQYLCVQTLLSIYRKVYIIYFKRSKINIWM